MSKIDKIAEITVHDGRKIAVWLPNNSERVRKYVAIALGPSHRIHRDNLTAEQALELAQALIRGATQVIARRSEPDAQEAGWRNELQRRIDHAIHTGEIGGTVEEMLAILDVTSASAGT